MYVIYTVTVSWIIIPACLQICIHVAAGKKCQYIGNCSFAHSTEERDLWTFMKDNNSKSTMRFANWAFWAFDVHNAWLRVEKSELWQIFRTPLTNQELVLVGDMITM